MVSWKMLKKLLLVSVVSTSAFITPIAMADISGYYLTAGIGTGLETDIDGSINSTDFSASGRTTFAGSLGLGYDFDNRLRIEVGVTSYTADVDSVTVSGTKYDVDEFDGPGLSVAVAYDFENDSAITPFIAGSYGVSWADDSDDSQTFNGYGIDFGLSTPVSDGMELWGSIGLDILPVETINSVKYDALTSWGFATGLRIRL